MSKSTLLALRSILLQKIVGKPILLTRCAHSSSETRLDVQKLIKVAVIGDPNAGKSSLINSLLGRKVNSVSRKVHTTRRNTLAVLNEGTTQMVFVDTPGFVSSRSSVRDELDRSLLVDPYLSVHGVDVVVVVHDAQNFYTKHRLSPEIIKALRFPDDGVTTALTLNKTDLLKDKKELLTLTATLAKAPYLTRNQLYSRRQDLNKLFDNLDKKGGIIQERPLHQQNSYAIVMDERVKFDQVFMTSATQQTGITPLKDYLLSLAKPNTWVYKGGFITDQTDTELITLCVKEKLLDLLTEEIPYQVQLEVDFMSEDESGMLSVQVSLICPSRRLASAVMGKAGSTIRDVALAAELSLSETFNKPVHLRLIIQNKKAVKPRVSRATG